MTWSYRAAAICAIAAAVLLTLPAACAGSRPAPAAAPVNDSGGALSREQAAYDVRHYDLALTVDPRARTVDGVLTVRARLLAPLSTLVLDLDPALAVRGADRVGDGGDGGELAVERDGGQVRIALGAPLPAGREVTVAVAYGGRPRQAVGPPWGSGFVWSRDGDGRPWIGVACQVDGADVWWPVKDHPSDEPEEGMDLRFTLPAHLEVASNGRLVGVETARRGWRTWHWRVDGPIQPYAVTLNAARYRTLERPVESVGGEPLRLVYWVLPADLRRVEEHLPELLAQFAFLEQTVGPYPFRAAKLGFAETPYSAMEHQTIVALGRRAFEEERSGIPFLPLHELAHEWFGNQVSAAEWSDLWIHEGFASYLEALYVEHRQGREAYLGYMHRHHLPAVAGRRPLAPRRPVVFRWVYGAGDGDVYGKGAWVLHTLRWLLGDETFFTALRRTAYPRAELERVTDGGQCRQETTEGVRRIFERVSGRDLGWFFEVYLRRAGLPRLVSEVVGDRLVLDWEAPDSLPFPMPVAVELPDGSRLRLEVPQGGAVLEGPWREARPRVDPEGWILRQGLVARSPG